MELQKILKFLAFKVNHFQGVLLPFSMKLNSYQKIALTTVFATLFLILVGGIVRSTGSGMGCPDWPKCFGSWIPPTSVEELPEGYQEIFVEKRVKKNEKIAGYLERLGFTEIAYEIKNDPDIKREEEFNATKTWIEYLNRLVGAVIGILVFLTFLSSLKYWKSYRAIPILSFLAVFLTGFQGWLGSIVVSTNLLPGMITVHMILAMVIVNLLLYGAFKASENYVRIDINESLKTKLWNIGLVILILSTIQMILGTQVREEIDSIKNVSSEMIPPRSTWIESLGQIFDFHRTFSWLLVISGVYLGYLLWKEKIRGQLKKIGIINVALIVAQILIGIGLAYLDVPKILQVLHLVGIALMICAQFLMLLMLKVRSKSN
jgi:cytochrome c oxidase assembly protein subunit 15